MKVVNKKIVGVLVVTLMIIELCSLFLVYKSFNNKETKLDEVKLQEKDTQEVLAIMIEQEDGTYAESSDNAWPTEGYNYDEEKSGCIDINGNKIDNSLTYDSSTNIVTIDTDKTSYCYVYFSIKPNLYELCSEYDSLNECANSENIGDVQGVWNNSLENGYRYVGTNPANHICFGTSDKDTCVSDTDKYMYRIIGIFEDTSGYKQLKLIKKEALNTAYYWHSKSYSSDTSTIDTSWPDSDLYKGLNGITGGTYSNIFVSSGDYSYMATGGEWYNRIATAEWKYGDVTEANITALEMYELENNFTNTTSAKIGLMYLHDYVYGMAGGNNCTVKGEYATCKTSWIHLSNNDSATLSTTSAEPPLPNEQLMTRGGFSSNYLTAWYIASTGTVNKWMSSDTNSVRPVFYLISDITINSGSGTVSDPFIIE